MIKQHRGRHAARTRNPIRMLSGIGSFGTAVTSSLVTAVLMLGALAFVGAAFAILSLHVSAQTVLTGSMRGTFDPGAVVLSRPVPVAAIRPGDVIVFTPPGHDHAYTHRVVTVSGSADRRVVTTKGDANPAPDAWKAQLTGETVPRVFWHVPYVGRAVTAVAGRGVHTALLGALGVLVAYSGARLVLGSPRQRHRPTRPTALPA
ncbi:MAG: signal peptidase [Frankiales bacterium]|nr:signal peptidase [Frankiales bacterium]